MPLTFLATLLIAAAPAEGGVSQPLATARGLATELAAGQFEAAVARFEPEVAKRLPAPKLAQQWKEIVGELGSFQRLGEVREESDPREKVIFVECVYERASVHLKIGLDAQLRVVSLRPTSGKPPEAFEAAARELVGELSRSHWARAVARFSPQMLKGLPVEALAKAWGGVVGKAGTFQRVTEVRLDPSHPPYTLADVSCAFEKESLTVRVVLDGSLLVSGLFFRPAWNPPGYADATVFEERPVTVGSAPWALPGTLTLPKGKGPFPAIVLVHGSGPHDADESLGPHKLFKDLAWGLASRKIAVLRYPKRTFQYRGKLSNADIATVKEETTDDALAAVAALAGMKEIDGKRLFVVGHSLGAGLAPRIAAAEPRVHGVVLLAGATRKQWHLVVEQRRYLAGLSGPPTEAGAAAIRQAEESAKKLDDPKLTPEEIVDGIAGTYWLDLRREDPAVTAARWKGPMLVLQGERDYQVTMRDFAGWKKALGSRSNTTLRSYPALNHHFMPGTGKSTPAEYEQPGHVPVEVVDELAKWLLAH